MPNPNFLTWRVLPPDEWPRLKTDLPDSPLAALPSYESLNGVIIVVERDGHIVAHWPLILTWHAEPVYIATEERGNSVVVRLLLEGLWATMQQADIPTALVHVEDPDVESIVVRLGFTHVPGAVYYATAPAPPS